jgi:DnaJ-class molecular chaperone
MHAQDFYAVLGVGRTATQQEIRQAFRRLVRKLHPDGAEGKDADAERLREVLEAYSVLGHPHRRAAYDQALHREEAASPLWAAFPAPHTSVWPARSVFDDEDLLWRIFRWFS